MLGDPSPEAETQPVKFISRTKANCLEMPFNRLEQRHLQRAMTNFSALTSDSLVLQVKAHHSRGVVQNGLPSEEAGYGTRKGETMHNNGIGEAHAHVRNNEARVNNFLSTLEPVASVLSHQSEQFGRLSPAAHVESEMSGTPGPSALLARPQLEREPETNVHETCGGLALETAVKKEAKV